ncbi:site-specific DNA-methyltransferase [Nocardioides bruguierae]|uniref:Site-specific DNA-methyltransferase n=1 Tax=Nocardioides bruguierae TaxID=2945102 RepID=A0A9X2D6K4_9ACTN|nr:DNA methyltransferase [Nocardioides bruguierae]MCM0620118.1 site-specific DNA-methyltransferase [Nocardioides bruguierae]
MTPQNTFLEGDNLEVLARLAAEGTRFDLAYLDPPYNTRSDLVYDDAVGRGRGRHQAWTAALRPRLEAVLALLEPTGALAVSIDDHEVAHLRLLLDEVVGEQNLLAQVVVNLNPKGRQLGGGFATSHEYLLVYAVDSASCVLDASTADTVDERDFGHTDEASGRRYRLLPLRNTNKRFTPASAPTLHYVLHGDPASGRVATTPFAGSEEITPVFGDGQAAVWRWSPPLVAERGGEDLVCRRVRGHRGERVDVYQRDWLHEGRRKKLTTVWLAEEVGSTDTAVAELKDLVGHVFSSPKPTGLLRRLLGTMPADARVLDPFAGSGTTGHAVALLNAEDGGTRTSTSIDRAAPLRTDSPAGRTALAAGHATVADVTRARLRAVDARLGGGLVCG